MKNKRIVLKISGEVFGKDGGDSIILDNYYNIAKSITQAQRKTKAEISLVVGGGNIFRGRNFHHKKFDRVIADRMGMLSTIINALGLREVFSQLGVRAEIMSAIETSGYCDHFSRRRTNQLLKEGYIVIFAGGTGNPFFTTDSAAILRACEIKADLILKATDVDGVYNKDPDKFKDAKKYDKLSFDEALDKKLKVMDSTAFAMCRDNKKPLIVFNIKDISKLPDIISGRKKIGTIVE